MQMTINWNVAPFRACLLCLADLSFVQAENGPTYMCRYCSGGDVVLPRQSQVNVGTFPLQLCAHPAGARHIVDDGRTTFVVCSNCNVRHTIGASLNLEEILGGRAGRL